MNRTPPETNIDLLSLPWEQQAYIHPDQLTPDSLVRVTDEKGEVYVFRLMPVGQEYYVYADASAEYHNVKLDDGSFVLRFHAPGTNIHGHHIPSAHGAQNHFVIERIISEQESTSDESSPKVLLGFPYAGFRKKSPLVLIRSMIGNHVIDSVVDLEAINILPRSPLEQTLLRFMEEYLSDAVRQKLAQVYMIDEPGPHENLAPGFGQALYYDSEIFDHHVAQIAYLLHATSDSLALDMSLDTLEELCNSITQYVELHTADCFSMAYGYEKEISLTDINGETRVYSLRFQITSSTRVLACFNLKRKPS